MLAVSRAPPREAPPRDVVGSTRAVAGVYDRPVVESGTKAVPGARAPTPPRPREDVGETRVDGAVMAHAVPSVGDRIGQYVIDRVIGSGGMGLVVAARHEALEEVVAIKLLRPKAARDKVQSERFTREARAIIKIKSEHVVRVLDAGTTDGGAPYIVMEYLVGRDLAQILRADGPMPPVRAADLMLQVCEAVASAHAVGVVHRDLKPANFFVTQRTDGTTLVKVLDFGISKAIGQDGLVDPNLTETQAVFGSPTYMSPEQIRSAKHVDYRTDIWSLGVAFYELVTGKLPFAADNVAGLLASIIADPPFFPRAFAPDLPEELETLLLACLAKDPNQRLQSVADFAIGIAPFATQNVETQNLVERVQRLSRTPEPISQPALASLDPAGSTTTGPKLPPAVGSGGRLPMAGGPAPLGAWPPGVHPRAPVVAVGSTSTDLSAEAPLVVGRSVLTAVAIGVGVAVLILGAFGAYWAGTRSASTAPRRQPELAASAAPIAEVPLPPATSASTAAASASAAASATSPAAPPSASASTPTATPKKSPSRGPSKAPPPATSSATPKPPIDPTKDRF